MQKKKRSHLFAALLFPAVLIYYEIVLRASTVRGFSSWVPCLWSYSAVPTVWLGICSAR